MMKSCALLLVALVVFTACSPAPVAEVPTLLVLPTDGPTPTSTRLPTETPTATITASPGPISPPDPADCDIRVFWEQAEPVVQEYLDTLDVAASTSRIAIAPILLELKRVQRSFENIPQLECDPYLQSLLSFGIDFAYEGFAAFSSESELLAAANFQLAAESLYAASHRLQQYGIVEPIDLALVGIEWGVYPNERDATKLAVVYFNTETPTFTPSPTATATPTPTITPTSTPLSGTELASCVEEWWVDAQSDVIGFFIPITSVSEGRTSQARAAGFVAMSRDSFRETDTPTCALPISRSLIRAMDLTSQWFSSDPSSSDFSKLIESGAYYHVALSSLNELGIESAGTEAISNFIIQRQLSPPNSIRATQIAEETQ